jgi:hypothetical protein
LIENIAWTIIYLVACFAAGYIARPKIDELKKNRKKKKELELKLIDELPVYKPPQPQNEVKINNSEQNIFNKDNDNDKIKETVKNENKESI